MKLSRLLLIVLLACVAVSWFPKTAFWKKTKALHLSKQATLYRTDPAWLSKLGTKADEARSFIKQKGFNNNHCFLIDMSLPSGQNRFFIYDLKKDSLQSAGLVAHGNCYEYWLEGRKYSNKVGSGCTSLGKYKIGGHYTGKWGYSYKLYGLDSSNNNALERTVVLHSHSCVPETEVTEEICQSNGCPTVAPIFLEQLKQIINASKKPVLLWIYE
ncbi:MAG TPA: murein L,D-transpeptidase catalytic domain family protein [Chitinophagaceae bacterium]|nr:murein L,D-transpeptidase catalytic domain family protein [Chitinophagaceae bacterium]